MRKDKSKTFYQFSPHGHKGKLIREGNTAIEHTVAIDLSGNVTMKRYAKISHEVRIFTHQHGWNHSRGLRKDIQKIKPIDLVIEEDAFIGVGAIIIGVSRIGKGAVVGAGSVLTKNVPDYEVWAGNPAKKIGERKDGN